MNFVEYLKFAFSSSYRRKYIADREMRIIGHSEVNWNLVGGDGNKNIKILKY